MSKNVHKIKIDLMPGNIEESKDLASFEENARVLTRFGLTFNQAKIYLANVELGTTSIEPISKISMVRREDVYRILPKLYDIGIVEKVLGNPTRVRAIPAGKAMTLLVKNRQEASSRELNELALTANEFSKNFRPVIETASNSGDDCQFSLISGKHAMREKVLDILEETKEEISAALSGKYLFKFLNNYFEILERSLEKGVTIQIISDAPQDESNCRELSGKLKSFYENFALRYMDRKQSDYVISDKKIALFNIKEETSSGNVSLLWTNNRNFVSLLTDDFDNA
ncbi:MAG: hypothetical protein LUP99_02240 [Methanomicrobiales archaeon]|nr:hypothetical protein [Methanomicrobiales archaeon]